MERGFEAKWLVAGLLVVASIGAVAFGVVVFVGDDEPRPPAVEFVEDDDGLEITVTNPGDGGELRIEGPDELHRIFDAADETVTVSDGAGEYVVRWVAPDTQKRTVGSHTVSADSPFLAVHNEDWEPLVSDGPVDGGEPFVLVIDSAGEEPTWSGDDEFFIETGEGSFDYTVEWSADGETVEGSATGLEGGHLLEFDEPGTYQLRITGELPHLQYDSPLDDGSKIMAVDQWGDLQWESFEGTFVRATNLRGTYADEPDLSSVESMREMFFEASEFDGTVADWNTTNVEDTSDAFRYAESFDGDVTGWDVSNVENMSGMFSWSGLSDRNLNEWDTSNVTDTSRMFHATEFDGSIGEWNTSNVQDMNRMFFLASEFDGDIGAWDTSNTENMTSMFRGAEQFDQDLSGWCVAGIAERPHGFDDGAAFEGDEKRQPSWGGPC